MDHRRVALAAIVRAAREENPDAVVFGEVVTDHVASWCEADGALRHAGTEMATREHLIGFLRGDASSSVTDASRFARLDARSRFRRGEAFARLAFATTHDHPRTRTTLRNVDLARLAPELPALAHRCVELAAGRLDERPLLALWNADVVRSLRRAALRAHPRETRERCTRS